MKEAIPFYVLACSMNQYTSNSGREMFMLLLLVYKKFFKMCAQLRISCEEHSVLDFSYQMLQSSWLQSQLCEVDYGNIMSDIGVKQWCCMFKNCWTIVHDEERSDQPSIVTDELVKIIYEQVHENCCYFTTIEISSDFPQIFCMVLYQGVMEKLP